MWPAEGGFWIPAGDMHQLQRYYEGFLLTVDFAATGITGILAPSNCSAYEDSNGDLWVRCNETLYHAKRPALQTRILSPQAVAMVPPVSRVEFAGSADAPSIPKARTVSY